MIRKQNKSKKQFLEEANITKLLTPLVVAINSENEKIHKKHSITSIYLTSRKNQSQTKLTSWKEANEIIQYTTPNEVYKKNKETLAPMSLKVKI